MLFRSGLVRMKPVTRLEIVSDKETVSDFSVHHLPGHTLGSLGFLKSNVFFSGDAAATTKKGEVQLGPKIVTESTDYAIASLKKMAKLKFEILLPGHGPPILHDASDRVIDASSKF